MKINFIDYKKFSLNFLSIILITTLPISLLLGSGVINVVIILIDFIFLAELIKDKNIKYLNNKLFYAFLILWLSLFINVFFSDNFNNSILRALGFIRFIIFVFAIKYYVSYNNYFNKEKIFNFWFIVIFVVTLDLLFESYYGFNTLGFSNDMIGRLSGFLNQELKIGGFYYGFILIALSFIYQKYKNLPLLYFFTAIFLLCSFLIGERSNFIKVILIVSFFVFFADRNRIIKNIIFIITLFSIIGSLIYFNDNSKERFYNLLIEPIITDLKISKTLQYSHYGAHYDTAIKIFYNNPVFGVGLKNYRYESGKDKYINKEFIFTHTRQSTHPHQIHFEFLSETGLFGYLSFLIFFIYYLNNNIKRQIKNKNLYHLSGILFVFVYFLPLLPSGSFFTTFAATIFWINFSIIEAFNNDTEIKS
jgi:O-antigen ligase